MHDSFTPLGGLVPMFLMQLGEVVFGGVGSGLYGMIVFAIIAVFIAGLMVGRTPEYLGKKIEAFEMKMASLAFSFRRSCVLVGTAIAVVTPHGRERICRTADRTASAKFSTRSRRWATTTAARSQGTARTTRWYNFTGGLAMLLARYWVALPVLAIAGSLARKKIVPAGPGTLPTHTPLFVALLAERC